MMTSWWARNSSISHTHHNGTPIAHTTNSRSPRSPTSAYPLLLLTILTLLLTIAMAAPRLDIRSIPIGDGYPNGYIDGYYHCDEDDCDDANLSAEFDSWGTSGFAPNAYSLSIFDPSGTSKTYVTQRGTFKLGEERLTHLRIHFPQPISGSTTGAQKIVRWRLVIHLTFPTDSLPRKEVKPVAVTVQMETRTETVKDQTYFVFIQRGISASSVGVLYRIRDSTRDSGLTPEAPDLVQTAFDDHIEQQQQHQQQQQQPQQHLDNDQDDPKPEPTPSPIDDGDGDDEETWYNYQIASDGIYRTNFISKDYTKSQSSSVHVTTMAIPTDEFRIRMEKSTHDVKRLLISPFGSFAFLSSHVKKNVKCTLNGETLILRTIPIYPQMLTASVTPFETQDGPTTSTIRGIEYDDETQQQQQQQQQTFLDSSPFVPLQTPQPRELFSIIAEFDTYFNTTATAFIPKGSDLVLHCYNMTLVNDNLPHGILVNIIDPTVPRSEFPFTPQYTTTHYSASYTLTSAQYSALIHPEHIESTSSGPIPRDHHKKRQSQYIWVSQHRHIYKLHNAMIPVTGDYSNWFMNLTLSNMNGYRLDSNHPYIQYYFGVPTQSRSSSTCFPQHAIYQRLQEQRPTDAPTGKFPPIRSPMFDVSRQIDTSQGAFLIVEYQLEMRNGWKEDDETQRYTPPTFKLSIAQTDPLNRPEPSQNGDQPHDSMQIFNLEMVQDGDRLVSTSAASQTKRSLPDPDVSLSVTATDQYFYIDEISSLSHFTRLAESLASIECSIDKLDPEDNVHGSIEPDGSQPQFSLLSLFQPSSSSSPLSSSKTLSTLASAYNTIATPFGLDGDFGPRPKKYINLDTYYLNALKALPDQYPIQSWSNVRTVPDPATKLARQHDFNPQGQIDLETLNRDQKEALIQLKTHFNSYSFNITFSDLMIDPDAVGLAITTALFDISTERYLFVLSTATDATAECTLFNHGTQHLSPTTAKSTRNELLIDQYEATSLFFRFTEELKPRTKYSITCQHIAISPTFAVLSDITPGKGIDHPRQPRKHLDTDPIPLHIYLFTTANLNQGLWGYSHFMSPGLAKGTIIAWVMAGLGMIIIGIAVYTFVFRRLQKKKSAAALAGATSDGADVNALGTEKIIIDASSAFGDDDGGYRQLG